MTSNWVGVRLYSVPKSQLFAWTLVKVDHPALVGNPQSPGCLGTPLRCFVRIRRGTTENALLERTTGNILHGHVVGSVPRASPIVGRDYVGWLRAAALLASRLKRSTNSSCLTYWSLSTFSATPRSRMSS